MTGPMIGPELTDLMRRESKELDPTSGQRILAEALTGGARRRRHRHLTLGATAVAVVSVLSVGTSLALWGGTATTDGSDPDVSNSLSPSPTPKAPTTYDTGSETEVPDGPVIPTDRRVAGDAALVTAMEQLLPTDASIEGLQVTHVESSNPTHMADKTRKGRRLSLRLDGATASVTIQRWDGYAAVGIGPLPGKGDLKDLLDEDLRQKAATTAREACAGSYMTDPPIECQQNAQGWYSVARPSQGDAVPESFKELAVDLYTDDGYVIHVDSYNSAAEKQGPVVSDQPVLGVEDSLALAGSPQWFVAK